jgi:phosphoribosylaminoimidazolecarboxamide formyltransferase/IMP cyclohydrolase
MQVIKHATHVITGTKGARAVAGNVVEKIDDAVEVRHVLASVSDKTGLEELVPALVEINPDVMIYSTGGTHKKIAEVLGDKASKNLMQVSAYTGQPEMQGGLVKTLDFKIYLGLLSETYNDAHADDLKRTDGVAMDMVVANLYPFKQTIAKEGATVEMARANIDIGGPCMVRASAKNYLRVASVTDPADYGKIVAELKETGGRISLATRFALAKKSFAHTADYDAAISGYLAERSDDDVRKCYSIVG